MRFAYSISGYKDPEQFAWLFNAIADSRDVFILHIDAKSPPSVHEGFRAVTHAHNQRHGNVHYLEPERIAWMGKGLVQAEFRAIAKAFQELPDFHCLINLSAQDYPLTSRAERVARLAQNPDANHIAMKPLKTLPFHIRRRRFLYSFEWRDRLIRTPLPRMAPEELQLEWKGSWWRVLSRPFCAWLLTSAKWQPYLRFLRHVQAPDELIMQNLIMDSPFANTVTGQNQHLVVWPGNSGSPRTLTSADWPLIEQSPRLFARKFDSSTDDALLRRLAARIGAEPPQWMGNDDPPHQQPPDRRQRNAVPDDAIKPVTEYAYHGFAV